MKKQIRQLYSIEKQPPDLFYKKGALRNFVKLTGKHLWQSLFIKKMKL